MRLTLVPDRAPRTVHPYGARRRMEALAAIGWTIAEQERRLGHAHANMFARLTRQERIQRSSADAIDRLFRELGNTPAPDSVGGRRAIARAAREGWPRPGEWDDAHIDLPPDELAAALAREVAWMSSAELRECARARWEWRSRAPLTVAASREFERLKSRRRRERARGVGAVQAA